LNDFNSNLTLILRNRKRHIRRHLDRAARWLLYSIPIRAVDQNVPTSQATQRRTNDDYNTIQQRETCGTRQLVQPAAQQKAATGKARSFFSGVLLKALASFCV
jgi:hypothetical protein